MKTGIGLCRSSSQTDEFELSISVSNGESLFVTEMYASTLQINSLYASISTLAKSSGIFDFQFGRFGPEYAGGSVSIRFHIRGEKIFLSIQSQARFKEFGQYSVADEAKFYLVSQLALLDNFIAELSEFKDHLRDDVFLEVI